MPFNSSSSLLPSHHIHLPFSSFPSPTASFNFLHMDLCAVDLKNATARSSPPFRLRNIPLPPNPNLCKIQRIGFLEIRITIPNPSSYGIRSMVLKATAKNNSNNNSSDDSSSSPGNGNQSSPEGVSKRKNSSENNKPKNPASRRPQQSDLDWREFRAYLIREFEGEKAESDAYKVVDRPHVSKPLGSQWAHPISVPETGCLLVATEKLDGVPTFERTVILLLRSGSRHPQEGPFGIVINRPLHKKIKHMKPTNNELATTFSDCSLQFGGPLEASMFLLRTGEKSRLSEFEQVIPGLCFGARNSLDEAAELVKRGVLKPQDFKFFVGYAGWQLDQLREEIESDYWCVAACSRDLIFGSSLESSSENLWEDILQLMGGQYSELSRKPKQDI